MLPSVTREVAIEPIDHLRQDVDLITDFARAVTFVGVHDEFRRNPERHHRVPELESLRRRNFLVAFALEHEHGRGRCVMNVIGELRA